MGSSPVTQHTSEALALTSQGMVASGCPAAPGGYAVPPDALGPDSLTWRYFGDWRGMLQGPWAGSMQNMHPQLGAAVEEHSTFFRERWPRLLRSLYPIGGVVFDGDRAPTTGAEVRDYHVEIKGVDDEGRRYHALNPDVFYWAHATFCRHYSCGRTVLRRVDRSPEAAAVRRARRVVSHVWDEHAACARVLGGVSGLLGSHVPQR